MTYNMYLGAAVLVGLAAFAVALIAPPLKPAGIASVALVLGFILWRQWRAQ